MNDLERQSDASQRIEESVDHALRLVGPGERSMEYVSDEQSAEVPAA